MKRYTIELWEIPNLDGSIELPILANDDKHALLKTMKFVKSVAETMEDDQIVHDPEFGDLYPIAITLGEGWREDIPSRDKGEFYENSKDVELPNTYEFHTMADIDGYIKMYSD